MQDVDQKQKSIGSGLMKTYDDLKQEVLTEAYGTETIKNILSRSATGIKNTPGMIGKGISSAAKYTGGKALQGAKFAGAEAGKMPYRALKGIADVSKANRALGWGVKGVALAGLLYGGYQANKALKVAQEKGEEIKRRRGLF